MHLRFPTDDIGSPEDAPTYFSALPLHGAAGRILIVMQDFAGGGTERVAVQLANSWFRAGREVRIFCGSEQGPARDGVDSGVEVVCATPSRSRRLLSRLSLGKALVDAVIQYRPDIVFAPGNFHIPVLAMFHAIAGRDAVPTVCKLSNPLALRGPRWLVSLHKRIVRWLTARITHFTAMSPVLRDEARLFLGRDDLDVAYDPIDLPPFRMPRSGQPGDPLRILCVGRLERQKDFGLAIRAFAQLRRKVPARLLILGEGRDRTRLMRLVRRLDLAADVTMPGHAPSASPAFAEADLLLCTSRYEGYPAAQIEALAAGLPVVTTPCTAAMSELKAEGGRISLVSHDHVAIALALGTAAAEGTYISPLMSEMLDKRHGSQAASSYLEYLDAVSAKSFPFSHRSRSAA
jgi:glycosyltransferase involved in cell wall biosynthesis